MKKSYQCPDFFVFVISQYHITKRYHKTVIVAISAIKRTFHAQKFRVISFFNKDESFLRDLLFSFLYVKWLELIQVANRARYLKCIYSGDNTRLLKT